MQQTSLFIEIKLRSAVSPEEQRAAAFAELRTMLKMFRRVPFATDGNHEEIYITDIQQVDGADKREAPD